MVCSCTACFAACRCSPWWGVLGSSVPLLFGRPSRPYYAPVEVTHIEKSRNYLSIQVSRRQHQQFSAISHPGVCGDPFKPKEPTYDSDFFGSPCDPIITYEEGQVIDITILIQAQHGGMWEMRLCDQPGSSFPSQDCFNKHVLKRCAHARLPW